MYMLSVYINTFVHTLILRHTLTPLTNTISFIGFLPQLRCFSFT